MSHGRTYSEQRYSPLDQINRNSVKDLALAWVFDMNSSRGLEASPIVVDGVMFVTGAWSIVHAIDPKSGEELWRFDPQVPRNLARKFCCGVVNRGIAVWQGKVIVGTLDGRLISLDAATGAVAWEVDTLIDSAKDYSITGAPRVARGKVFIGNGGADMGGVRGYASAYDVASGELVWRFYTVPGDPSLPFEHAGLELAAKTWNGEWWKFGGGGTVWNSIVYDPEFNQVVLGTGNGSPWNQQIRSPGGGDNLFLASIVALDADSGSLRWYYQTPPADRWDFTATQDIILADMAIDGAQRKVLMQASKNGFFYVLDRETGELLRAEIYVQTNWASHVDMETGRPVLNPDKDYYEKAVWVIPGSYGGHNWQPMAYDPVLRLAFIPSMEVPAVHEVKKSYARTGQFSMIPGAINTGTQFNLLDTTPAMQEGVPMPGITGALIAFDPVTGERRWAANQEQFWNGACWSPKAGWSFRAAGRDS